MSIHEKTTCVLCPLKKTNSDPSDGKSSVEYLPPGMQVSHDVQILSQIVSVFVFGGVLTWPSQPIFNISSNGLSLPHETLGVDLKTCLTEYARFLFLYAVNRKDQLYCVIKTPALKPSKITATVLLFHQYRSLEQWIQFSNVLFRQFSINLLPPIVQIGSSTQSHEISATIQAYKAFYKIEPHAVIWSYEPYTTNTTTPNTQKTITTIHSKENDTDSTSNTANPLHINILPKKRPAESHSEQIDHKKLQKPNV